MASQRLQTLRATVQRARSLSARRAGRRRCTISVQNTSIHYIAMLCARIGAGTAIVLSTNHCIVFQKGQVDQLCGTPPEQDANNPENLVSLFVTEIIDDKRKKVCSRASVSAGNVLQDLFLDSLRILLYQLASLFVEHAPLHIHDPRFSYSTFDYSDRNAYSKQSQQTAGKAQQPASLLRKFLLLSWQCTTQTSNDDPTVKYHGHLLICHIIDKFAINRKIVIQVRCCLCSL